MATHAPDFGRAEALPLSAVLESIPSYPRPVIERLVARLIEQLDEQDGDPELECDPFNEGEPAFDAQSRALVGRYPYDDPDHDAEPSAWLERTDQEQPAYPQGAAHFQTNEDAEDDDPAEDEHDAEGIDEREPDHDAEIETWSHPDDHPGELFIGRRL